MWGAASHDRSTGVHRPLTATAMVFAPLAVQGSVDDERADDEQVVVALDHCLLWAREMETLRNTTCALAQIRPEQFLAAFSHTHAAGLMGWEREDLPGGELIRPYLNALAKNIAEIITAARKTSVEATIVYGTGSCALAAQRDFWDDGSRQFVCGLNPEAPADQTVLIARANDARGELLASIVNYACHPTTLAWENTLISPDFPGAMRETVEQATAAPCVFLQGASGDLGPRHGFVGDVEVADRNGRQLGHAALAAFESLPPPATRFEYSGPVLSGATLGRWDHVPLSDDAIARNARWRMRRWTLSLPLREGFPTEEETLALRDDWRNREAAARAAGDESAAADCRAMMERMDRRLVRIRGIAGETFPLPITLWQNGAAFWVAVEGEPYNVLQTQLRARCPKAPIVVMAIANGSRCSYLPPRENYDKDIYQSSVAVLAPGCLEQLIDEIAAQIQRWLKDDPAD